MSEAAAAPQRLFFALWPADELRRNIEAQTQAFARHTGGRLTPARNFHVTLLFLGEVAASRIHTVREAAAQIRCAPFAVEFDQLEAWPGSNVLCLTCKTSPAPLSQLNQQLRTHLVERDFDLPRQGFRPHITLARDLPHMRAPERITPIRWEADSFVLVNSNMTRMGSKYTVPAHWPLESAA